MGKYFGTDGVRGVYGKQITANLAYKIGRFLGQYPNGHKNKILIARDTRISGEILANSVGVGVATSGSDVYNIGVSTTPSVSFLVRKHKFDFGIMISASHNPYFDNGIKLFNSEGEKLEPEIIEQLEKYIDSLFDTLPNPANEKLGRYIPSEHLIDDYIDYIVSLGSSKIANLKVFIDCANGSASEIAPKVLEKLGAKFVAVSNKPNGLNINDRCGSTKIAMDVKPVKAGDYDVGFAFDGDADRCLALSSDGEIVDGDGLLYLHAMNYKRRDVLAHNTVSITVMSNFGLKEAFKAQGINYNETDVGDKYVQADMKKNGFSIGGEQSGHIIFIDDLNTGDGLITMVRTLNAIAKDGKSLPELIEGLKIYPQALKNVPVVNKEAILSHHGFKEAIKEAEASLEGHGRILVRASGTEPLIRIMCEAQTQEICDKIVNDLAQYVEELQ